MRRIQVISFVVAALLAASANSQDLNGSFSTGPFGETFRVQGNGDGTADIYDSAGNHIGPAEGIGVFTRAKAVVSAKFKKRGMAVSKPMIPMAGPGGQDTKTGNPEGSEGGP